MQMNKGINLEQKVIVGSQKYNFKFIRGLNRDEAAAYIGISTTFFDDLVKDGLFPKPIRIKSRTIWDVRQLDAAFDALGNCDDNPWDAVQ
jgi:predicted DNA-binding transcriptional regulator AlpA